MEYHAVFKIGMKAFFFPLKTISVLIYLFGKHLESVFQSQGLG